jgi:hypothetical protein
MTRSSAQASGTPRPASRLEEVHQRDLANLGIRRHTGRVGMTGPDAAEQGTRLVSAAVSVSALIGWECGKAALRGEDFVDPQD